jgi:hypothetical protein
MSTLEHIVEELKTLPPAKLEEAAKFIHRLRAASGEEALAILRETAGAWGESDGDAIGKAIDESCERIDPRDW